VGKEGPGGWLELAERYGGLVKPDIVFFGEQARWALKPGDGF
jgi:NAD-dependent deacetylase sirtuin 2